MKDEAERDWPGLREWAERLLAISRRIMANARYSEEDDLSFMALCLFGKQIDHLESVVILVPKRDAILIARSMIEGMCQLFWAARDPGTRPSQWRNFVWVHDWRTVQQKSARGVAVDPEVQACIEDGLRRSGDRYVKGKARKARDSGAPWPDPYHDNWRCGTTVWEMCESVGAGDLYRRIYKPFSDWQHGGVGKLGEALQRRDDRVVYSSDSPKDAATALAVGFQCLLQTAQLTDGYLKLGFGEEISELRDGYVAWNANR